MKNVMSIIIKKWLIVFLVGLLFLIFSFPVIADYPTVELIPSFPLIIADSLNGKKIGLDPGHGGSDPGAVGWDGPGYPNEEDFNLDVGLRLRTQLQSDGATVVMTRTTDTYVSLDARVNFINNENPHAFISIHCNSFTDPSAHGTETYWHIQGTAADQKLAGYVQNRLVEKLGTTNRGVKQADFRVLEVNSWIPAVLGEMLFISNQGEFNIINSTSGKDKAMSGFRLGICDFFGVCGQPDLTPYMPPGWPDKIVVSKTTGTHTDDPNLTTDDTLYVDWAVINQGTADITNRFYYYLYVDGGKKAEWYSDSLPAGWYARIEDYSIGKLSAGNHTITIVADPTKVINESNENNNEYSKPRDVIPTKPNPPTLVSPQNGSHQTCSITFQWTSVSGATKYKLFVKLPGSSSWLSDETTATSYPYSPTLMGEYHWKVQAYANGNWSDDSSEWIFYFDGLPAPTLISPPNNSETTALRPTFQWSSVSCSTCYELQLARDSSFTDMVRDNLCIYGTSWQLDNQDLTPGQTYYWRVRSSLPIGHWSEAWHFTVTLHTVTITSGPTANPSTIASGGTTNLSVSATDSYGHSVNYSWTVNPNEGNFTPNPNTQNPTWTAPANNTCADKTYTFTVTATCSVDPSVKKTGTVQVIVKPAPHTVTITSGPTANPNPIDSGSTTSLSVTAIDSCGHNINYSWTVNPNEGNFTPNPNTQNPTWTAPANDTCADKTYTFTVTATCSVDSNVKDTKTVQVTVKPEPHTVTITSGPTANPTTINSGGVTNLNVSATDSCGHSVNYSWTVNPNEGSFSPNPNTQNPTWTAPENNTDADKIYTFTATATCSVDSNVKDTGTVQVKVKPKPHDSPTITAIVPNSCCQGTDSLNVVIAGKNFQNGATVTFSGTGITINSTTVDSDTQITLEIDVTSTAEASSRNVTVTNPDSRSGTLEDGFTVYATPTITKITPNEVAQGETVDMVITGTGFQDGLTVNFCNGVTKNSTTVDSSTQITVNITVSQTATLDQCQVTVTNPGGCEGSGVFTITPQCGCFADIDCDGDVDIVDIQKVAGRWNTKCGDDRYVADYDIDKDCDIDIVDIQKVAGHWGETGPPWERCTQTPAPQRELQNALSTLIKLKADKSKVRVGERIRLIVQIERAVKLGAAEFQIPVAFDGSFAVRKIEIGSFPKSTGNTVIPLKSDSSSNREVAFGFVSLGENPGAYGNGVLASIELEAQAQGKVTFELSNVQITDKMGNPLPVSIDAPLPLWAIEIPTKSALLQNFPNPFNPETWIPYKLAFTSNVDIQIYNEKGQLVRRLSEGRKEAGYYLDRASAAYWDGKNEMGELVSSGIYFYQIRAGEFHAVRKMVISK